MTERTAAEWTERDTAQPQAGSAARSLLSDAGLLVLLVGNGLLLGAFGMMFTPLYRSGIPVPMGIVLSVLVLPWLVRQAGEIDPRPAVASSPLLAWVVAVVVFGLFGPGGDAMLTVSWQSLLLVVAGIVAGMWGLRSVLMSEPQGKPNG